MILSGKEIIRQHELGNIYIENFNAEKVNPNSYNLTLNKKLKMYKPNKAGVSVVIDSSGKEKYINTEYIDSITEEETVDIIIPDDGLILMPGYLYLGSTNEWTKTDQFIPMIEGRSSFARLGVQVHMTAGFGDIGYEGTFTLEIATMVPVMIYPNQEICQIYYQKLLGDKSIKYKGKYNGNREAVASKLFTEHE